MVGSFKVNEDPQTDWWDKIDEEEKAEIEEGLAQADRGEVMSHEEVTSKYQKWRKTKFRPLNSDLQLLLPSASYRYTI